jgi:hypothetical protein
MGFSEIFAGVVFIKTSWSAKYNPFYASANACFGIVNFLVTCDRRPIVR